MKTGQHDSCLICINKLSNNGDNICVPCSNNHFFHQLCLFEWAKTIHSCPICRENFDTVKQYDEKGEFLQIIDAPKEDLHRKVALDHVPFELPYQNHTCEVCSLADGGRNMLLCDACDLGFHFYCLEPPLTSIPRGRWECPFCRPSTSSAVANQLGRQNESESRRNQRQNESERLYSEDDFLLGESDFDDALPILMPTRSTRRKKKSRKSKKKSNPKIKTRKKKRNLKFKLKKRKSVIKKKSTTLCNINTQSAKKESKDAAPKSIPIKLQRRMKSLALISCEDDADMVEVSTFNSNTSMRKEEGTHSICLDQILKEQEKILAPSNMLRINRDGTLEETEALKRFINRKTHKSYSNSSSSKDRPHTSTSTKLLDSKHESASPNIVAINLSRNGSGSVQSNMINSNSNGNLLSFGHIPTTTTNSSKLPINTSSSLGIIQNIHLPPPPPPPAQQPFLLPEANFGTLFGGIPSLFGGSNAPFSLNMLNAIGQTSAQINEGMLASNAQPPHNLLQLASQNALLSALGTPKPLLDFKNILLQNSAPTSSIKLPPLQPPPLPPPTLGTDQPLIVPPPPPPPFQTCTRSGCSSPMDIEEDDRNETSEKESGSKNDKKGRSKSVQMADDLMKRALKPYFIRRKITKEEYKQIMKRGVAKLKKRDGLRQEKVDKFVEEYVHAIRRRRAN